MLQTTDKTPTVPNWIDVKPDELESHETELRNGIARLDEMLASGLTKAEYSRTFAIQTLAKKSLEILAGIKRLI